MDFVTPEGSFEVPAMGAFPISPQSGFTLASPGRLNLAMTRFDSDHVRRVCAAWLGTPPDTLPLFSAEPFSPALMAEWQRVTDLFSSLHMDDPMDERASRSLEEYAIGLLLRGHPHSLTRFLEDKAVANRHLVEEAAAWIARNQQPHLTPVHVAEAFACPLAKLERGFREHMNMSMREVIYVARINAVETQVGNPAASPQRVRDEAIGTEVFDSRMTQKLERVRLHVMAHLSRSVGTSELAAVAGLSVNELRHAFRVLHGMTPCQYVARERLDWARSLLADTDKSMAAIAAETGFATQAHLNVAFKKNVGLTPGEWRRSEQNLRRK